MHLSYIIIRAGCNVSVDPLWYTYFDKHTFGRMHYVIDIHSNYVKKSRRNPKQPKPGVHDEPKRQPEKVPAAPVALEAPAQGSPAPSLLALSDTQSIILDELTHLRQMMMSRFDQMDRRITDLKSTTNAIWVIVDAFQAAQPPPPSS